MDYIGVVEAANNFDLAVEAAEHLGIGKKFLANDLQSNDAIHLPVSCLEHLAGPAFTETFQQEIRSQHEVGASPLEKLIRLIGGQPTALKQVAGQAARVGETSLQIGQDELIALRQVEESGLAD